MGHGKLRRLLPALAIMAAAIGSATAEDSKGPGLAAGAFLFVTLS